MLDDAELQDNPKKWWDEGLIMDLVASHVQKWNVDLVCCLALHTCWYSYSFLDHHLRQWRRVRPYQPPSRQRRCPVRSFHVHLFLGAANEVENTSQAHPTPRPHTHCKAPFSCANTRRSSISSPPRSRSRGASSKPSLPLPHQVRQTAPMIFLLWTHTTTRSCW